MALRDKLAHGNQIPHQLYDELQELKNENEMLRKDTIKLLHRY